MRGSRKNSASGLTLPSCSLSMRWPHNEEVLQTQNYLFLDKALNGCALLLATKCSNALLFFRTRDSHCITVTPEKHTLFDCRTNKLHTNRSAGSNTKGFRPKPISRSPRFGVPLLFKQCQNTFRIDQALRFDVLLCLLNVCITRLYILGLA